MATSWMVSKERAPSRGPGVSPEDGRRGCSAATPPYCFYLLGVSEYVKGTVWAVCPIGKVPKAASIAKTE